MTDESLIGQYLDGRGHSQITTLPRHFSEANEKLQKPSVRILDFLVEILTEFHRSWGIAAI
jgi:hypothetical protein